MMQELTSFYYQKALAYAAGDNLSAAVKYAAVAENLIHIPHQSSSDQEHLPENIAMLQCLCHERLGNYITAHSYLLKSGAKRQDIEESLKSKTQIQQSIFMAASSGDYRSAYNMLINVDDKSVLQYNYLGCICMLLKKQPAAGKAFSSALSLDCENADSLRYLRNMNNTIRKRWWQIWR